MAVYKACAEPQSLCVLQHKLRQRMSLREHTSVRKEPNGKIHDFLSLGFIQDLSEKASMCLSIKLEANEGTVGDSGTSMAALLRLHTNQSCYMAMCVGPYNLVLFEG